MSVYQAIHLSRGRTTVRLWVLIRQPRKVMISLRPPLANIFLIDAGSGRLVGSKMPARGRKIRKSAMTTAWEAQATILQLLFVCRRHMLHHQCNLLLCP